MTYLTLHFTRIVLWHRIYCYGQMGTAADNYYFCISSKGYMHHLTDRMEYKMAFIIPGEEHCLE